MRAIGRVLLVLGAVVALASCRFLPSSPAPDETGMKFKRVGFNALPNWNADSHLNALRSFLRSCPAIEGRTASDWFGPSTRFGKVGAWQNVCGNASAIAKDEFSAKEFFEANFRAYEVVGEGTFTGYYEVEVMGSRTKTSAYSFPVYAKPKDLNSRTPYYSRRQIDQGALKGRGLELLYLSTAADAFLLHVQGSGAIELTDGSKTRLSYAGNNGHDFASIYGALKANGYDPAVEGASMLDFRRWLNANPQKAERIIQANPRYIFFVESDGNGPIGAQGVELTAGRSLAVDDSYMAYGVPVYIDTHFLDPARNNARRDLERLVIAQDTGAAINGMVRGDFFWGTGETALAYAGRMKEPGRYFVLIPR